MTEIEPKFRGKRSTLLLGNFSALPYNSSKSRTIYKSIDLFGNIY